MRIHRALFLSLVAAGCASTGSGSTGSGTPSIADRERVVVTGIDAEGGAVAVRVAGSGAVSTTIDAPPAQVLAALRQAHAALGIPITLDDPPRLRLGNLDFHRTGSIGKMRMSRFVSCGDGITGPRADVYRIYLSLESIVVPAAGGASELRTALVASASGMAGGAPDRIPCGTTGVLEARIAELVRAQLARGG